MISIQESLIASEQVKAALDLKNAIEQEIIEENTPEGKSTGQKNPFELQYIMLAIIVVESIILVFLWYKKK